MKMIEIDYLTQIQCYRNSSIDIDAFVFHQGMTQWYHALILRNICTLIEAQKNFYAQFVEEKWVYLI